MREGPGPLVLLLGALAAASLPAPGAGTQGFGRLFSSPEERSRLDALRERGEPHAPPAPAARVQPAPLSRLTVNGVVMRDKGPDFVWINGERVSRDERTQGGIRGRGEAGARVRVTLPHGAGVVRLKAGQRVNLLTGAIRDAYETDPAAPPAAGSLAGAGTERSGP